MLKRINELVNKICTLNEMFVIGNTDSDCVVAFKDKIYLFNGEDWGNDPNIDKMIEDIKSTFPNNRIDFEKIEDWQDFKNYLLDDDSMLYLIFGDIDGDYINIGYDYFSHSKGSFLIKKVSQQLGKEIEFRDENGETPQEYDWTPITGSLPDKAYHGTSSAYIEDILRLGIRPVSRSNWGDIKHEGLVFFTSKFDVAQFHAETSNDKAGEENYPIVIEFKIPNKDLLLPDYDLFLKTLGAEAGEIYREFIEDSYPSITPRELRELRSNSRNIGIFGYKGRIPASFITTVYVDTGSGFEAYTPQEYKSSFIDYEDEYDEEDE
jgi:hypothetical protein